MCWRCSRLGYWGRECDASEEDQRKHLESQQHPDRDSARPPRTGGLQAFMADDLHGVSDTTYWYIDSGCTDHMIGNRSYFSTYKNISIDRCFVEGIGGSILLAVGNGNINIKIKTEHGHAFGVLQNVIHVPNIGMGGTCSHPMLLRKNQSLRPTWQMGVIFLTTGRL